MSKDIKLGCEAVDVVTGLSGTLTNRTELLGGTIQYALQLPGGQDAGRYPDVVNVDEPQIEIVGDGLSHKTVKPVPFKFKLGSEVEDKVSGFKGTITSRTVFINGCLYYMVEAKGEGKPEERTRFLVEQRLSFIDDGVAIKPRMTGGPVTRGMRAC